LKARGSDPAASKAVQIMSSKVTKHSKKIPTGGRAMDTTRTDLAQDIMGKNSLQGDDQSNVRNQRQAQSDVKLETDGIVESFEKIDKDVRAESDLGKGRRHKPPSER
jgi:hypothetical protein